MSFTLCTLNLNGLRSASRKGFLEWLEARRPDLLCLQEVRAWPAQVAPELRSPSGYSCRWVNAERKGYAGVALYTRTPPDSYQVGSGLDWSDAEGRVLRADLGPLSLTSAYIPSGSSSEERQQLKYDFIDHFLPWSAGVLAEGRPAAICGDFNIAHTPLDIHAPKRNEKNSGFLPAERERFSALLEQGWVDVLRALHPDEPGLYSWWSNRGRAREKDLGWRLDYILATPQLAKLATEAWIEKDAGLSDHAPVWVRFEWPEGQSAPVGKGAQI